MTALQSCIFGTTTDWSDGKYQVYQIDFTGRTLGITITDSIRLGRVPEHIIAVGGDENHIVAVRLNPKTFSTEFYYIPKQDDNGHLNGNEISVGPMDFSQFQLIKQKLKLPDFTESFPYNHMTYDLNKVPSKSP
jgi:hypothetical protein